MVLDDSKCKEGDALVNGVHKKGCDVCTSLLPGTLCSLFDSIIKIHTDVAQNLFKQHIHNQWLQWGRL